MSIFTDSYQTLIGSSFVTKHIETEIKKSLVNGAMTSLNVEVIGTYEPRFITGMSDENNIPLFTHPIIVSGLKAEKYLVTDLRPFLKKQTYETSDFDSRIQNRTEYNFAKSRAILNLVWLNRDPSILKTSMMFAGMVFTTWIADAISKVYALDLKDQTMLAIITSLYYQSLFTDDSEIDEEAKRRMAVHTINATRAPSELVFEVLDKITVMNDINDYCENVKSILENIRLENFNHAGMIQILKSSWYGHNALELVAISLEHPPTWIAMVYTAMSEKTYKNSSIYRVIDRVKRRGNAEEFMKNYVGLVKEHIVAEAMKEDDELDFSHFE
jgi:hypothetical protein